ncbi:MAG: pyridoxine 5'-phosphate synthase [Spirochaetia bacterium]|nr:pyridoxine 5'-phosphate synthase [Spirochaetia bacterium]
MTHHNAARRLSVNLDHIATLRQARRTKYPVVADGCGILERAGADGVTLHLRSDRRHIQDADVELVGRVSLLPLTLEMAATPEMADNAVRFRPHMVTLVPERPEERTTEGGLDCITQKSSIVPVAKALKEAGIRLCIFVEPDADQLKAALDLGAGSVELHTGAYADAGEAGDVLRVQAELRRIESAAERGRELGLGVNVGHGLHYQNVQALAAIPHVSEFSIGHAIIGRAVFTGLEAAVREMARLIGSRGN